MDLIDISHSQEIYTVTRLNREVRFLLEENFPFIWIEGEISNFSSPHSGHWYFCLKDVTAQVKCAMFRLQNRKLSFIPKDGMHVILKARMSLYEGRGEFQLIVEWMEDAGVGKLQKEFEALKKKLSEAGLFDPAHKKKLPTFPKKIGVITSPTGAAIRDILSVLKRRFSCTPVIIYPTLVQGDQAAPHIVKALKKANQRNECDVLILARGGGSIEDLWPFNEEIVAHAIFESQLPIISGVGHEIDFTIADFVADLRAPTPSAAAELITPDKNKLLEILATHQNHLLRCINHRILLLQQQLIWTEKHLQPQHPKRRLIEQQQRLDYCEISLLRLQNKLLTLLKTKNEMLKEKLYANSPKHVIRDLQHQMDLFHQKIMILFQKKMQDKQLYLSNLAATLDAISPLATLKRGFSIVTDTHQKVLTDSHDVKINDSIQVTLMKGSLECIVKNKNVKT